MRCLLVAALLLSPAPLFPQTAETAIRSVLDRQVADWNGGDVRRFMQGYDDSEQTLFIGSGIVRGYRGVLDRYLARYNTPEKMGRLTFSNIEVHTLGADFALVIGNFHLARSNEAGGDASGIFTLTFAKKQAGWKIIADHTSETPASQ